MQKLFFDFDVDGSRFRDQEGIDLPDAEAGRDEVLHTLAEVVKDALPKADHQIFRAYVRDSSGDNVYTATVTVTGVWNGSKLVA